MEGGKEVKKSKLDEYRGVLELFLDHYEKYISRGAHVYRSDDLRTIMQRNLTLVSKIVASIRGGGSLVLDKSNTINFRQAISYSLTDNLGDSCNFVESNVVAILNESIGNIINDTIPSGEIKPIIPIRDELLKERCSDILNAPGNLDRVIRESTLILEERLRQSVPYEKLIELIPLSKDQVGEPLANKLLSPHNPIIVISEKLPERIAFHKMVIGIIAYLRNPSHHSLNDNTDWALAWSVVGIVDSLLSELDGSYISGDKPKTKVREKKK